MGYLTRLTTNIRARRAAVVLYALILVGLLICANYIILPVVEQGARNEEVSRKGLSGAFFETARHGFWAVPAALVLALVIVYFVSRGRLDHRLTALSLYLVLTHALILAYYTIAFWWYYGSHYTD